MIRSRLAPGTRTGPGSARTAVFGLAWAGVLAVLGPAPAGAVVLKPTDIALSQPGGATAGPGTYRDDTYLERLDFGGTVFSGTGDLRLVSRFETLSGRQNLNAEWGDDDTGSDGDADPFTKAGLDPALQETTDPAIQDRALLNAFNSRSLTEMMDGESGDFSFKVLFENGLTDDSAGSDAVPEIVFVERGMNDVFDLSLILGGSFAAPELSATTRIDTSLFWDSGVSVDTREIGGAQTLGIGGFDLSDLGVSFGQAVYGFVFTRVKGGPDMNGFFLSSAGGDRYRDELAPAPVPLPMTAPLLLAGLGGLVLVGRLRR